MNSIAGVSRTASIFYPEEYPDAHQNTNTHRYRHHPKHALKISRPYQVIVLAVDIELLGPSRLVDGNSFADNLVYVTINLDSSVRVEGDHVDIVDAGFLFD